jgi:hypothetical protein
MTLDEIRKYTEAVADKDRSGHGCTEEQFNLYLKAVNIDLFNLEWDRVLSAAAAQSAKVSTILKTYTPLYIFKADTDICVGATPGEFALPGDYRHYLMVSEAGSGADRDIEVVDEDEFQARSHNAIVNNPDRKPFCRIQGGNIIVVPNDISDINLVYVSTPETPYYDWVYSTTTDAIYYMPEGSVLDGTDLKQGAAVLYANVAHTGTVADPYTGLSNELEWREDRHVEIANRILVKMGVNLRDGDMFQMLKAEAK